MQIEPNENASKRMESSVRIIPFSNDGKPRDAGGVYSNHKRGSIPCVRCADSLARPLRRRSSIRSFGGITATRRHKGGVFIGFESPAREGLLELGKKFNLLKGRDFRASVRRIQRHDILVVGSFIIGLNTDRPGIGKRIADVASQYGLDNLNTMFLTPLPGTRLWEQMKSEGRIALDTFPEDWKCYTLTFPVARYKHLSLDGILEEMLSCDRDFYSMPRTAPGIFGRRPPRAARCAPFRNPPARCARYRPVALLSPRTGIG